MLAHSGADAVMVGRAAQGRAWLPGWIAACLAAGREVARPSLDVQCSLALEHYNGLLSLYGVRSGVRHARKHLVSAMEAAEELAGPGDLRLRREVVTAEEPKAVADAFAAFFGSVGAESGGMNTMAMPLPQSRGDAQCAASCGPVGRRRRAA